MFVLHPASAYWPIWYIWSLVNLRRGFPTAFFFLATGGDSLALAGDFLAFWGFGFAIYYNIRHLGGLVNIKCGEISTFLKIYHNIVVFGMGNTVYSSP